MIDSESINKRILSELPTDLAIKLMGDTDLFYDVMTERSRLRVYDWNDEYIVFGWETGYDLQGFHLIGDIAFKGGSLQNQVADYSCTLVLSASSIAILNKAVRALVGLQPKIEIVRVNRSALEVYERYWQIQRKSKDKGESIPYAFPVFAIEYKVVNVPFSGKCINPCKIVYQNKKC